MDTKTEMLAVANHLESRAFDAAKDFLHVTMSPNECLALGHDIKQWANDVRPSRTAEGTDEGEGIEMAIMKEGAKCPVCGFDDKASHYCDDGGFWAFECPSCGLVIGNAGAGTESVAGIAWNAYATCFARARHEEEPTVNVRMRLHDGGSMPERHGDMIDLAASEDVVMSAGDVMVIPLGASIDMEGGATGLIVPRSSTCLKHGIMMANSIGIIDNDYNGDDDVLGFVAYAIRDTTIPKGTRIAQFAAVRFPRVSVRMVGSLGNESRGGFGSTGSMVEGA